MPSNSNASGYAYAVLLFLAISAYFDTWEIVQPDKMVGTLGAFSGCVGDDSFGSYFGVGGKCLSFASNKVIKEDSTGASLFGIWHDILQLSVVAQIVCAVLFLAVTTFLAETLKARAMKGPKVARYLAIGMCAFGFAAISSFFIWTGSYNDGGITMFTKGHYPGVSFIAMVIGLLLSFGALGAANKDASNVAPEMLGV